MHYGRVVSCCDLTIVTSPLTTRFIHLSDQDHNQDGKIMYTEFLAATIEAHGHIAEDRIAEAFDRLDTSETGFSKYDLAVWVVL